MGLTFEIETFKLVKSRLSDWKMIDLYFYRTLVNSNVNNDFFCSTERCCRPAIFLVLGFKPKFSKVQAIYKEINKAHLIVGIDMLIQAIHLPLISGFSLDKFYK